MTIHQVKISSLSLQVWLNYKPETLSSAKKGQPKTILQTLRVAQHPTSTSDSGRTGRIVIMTKDSALKTNDPPHEGATFRLSVRGDSYSL